MYTLKDLVLTFLSLGRSVMYVKVLQRNNNSKNQIYLAREFGTLYNFPVEEIRIDDTDRGRGINPRFKTDLSFYWVDDYGSCFKAPEAKLVYYPNYPEVRLSGFARGSAWYPELITEPLLGRVLFIGVGDDKDIFAYLAAPDSVLARQFSAYRFKEKAGVFSRISIESFLTDTRTTPRQILIDKLRSIHQKGWIESKRLTSDGSVISCNGPPCGGYTLEAEFGITPNSKSAPDSMGWEIKQFRVQRFDRLENARITLMTPEPTGGFYRDEGPRAFVERFGYPDRRGRTGRRNFGGIHKVNLATRTTGLTMALIGYDPASKTITDAGGYVALLDDVGIEAATWSFEKLLRHWLKKHSSACYVPSIKRTEGTTAYAYGNQVLLCEGTEFGLFLQQLTQGNIWLDPALQFFKSAADGKNKLRNQIRIRVRDIASLYHYSETITL